MDICMTPTTEISIGASAATGLTYVGGVLKHKGQAVSCVNPQDGLSQFITFIKSFLTQFWWGITFRVLIYQS